MNRYDLNPTKTFVLGPGAGGATRTGLALGSVYSYGVSGASISQRFIAPTSGNLNDVYFFVSAITGTPGNITIELRNWNAASTSKPGTTLHASQTVSPGLTANKWIKCTFATPFSVVKGSAYHIVIGDAGWTTGNTATVLYICPNGNGQEMQTHGMGYTSTDGFATAGTSANNRCPMVLKFADGTLYGTVVTLQVSSANNTRERGIKITGLTDDIIISGVSSSLTPSYAGFRIYDGNTAPGGTPLYQAEFSAEGLPSGGFWFEPFTLRKNNVYRAVFYMSTNTTSIYWQIEDVATGGSDFTSLTPGNGSMYYTIDNGAGGWTDSTDCTMPLGLAVQDLSPTGVIKGLMHHVV
jgi:hypothetical protein